MLTRDQIEDLASPPLSSKKAKKPRKPKAVEEQTICILDPPWEYKTYSKKGRKKCPKYDTASSFEIGTLGNTINAIIGKNAVCYMWVTAGRIPDALVIAANWGWEYTTWMAWKKTQMGLGYWARSDAEIVLVFKRGKVKAPKPGTQGRTLFEGKRVSKAHSSKPATLHQMLEKQFPKSKKIELFARNVRDGWTCVGGDLESWITPEGISRGA